MIYSTHRTKRYNIPMVTINGKLWVKGDKDYQNVRKCLHLLNRYEFKLIINPKLTFSVADKDEIILDQISLKALMAYVKRMRKYKRHHSVKQMHKNIDFIINDVKIKGGIKCQNLKHE